ncbi:MULTISPECIES: hypothetical protein [Streptomonospora]|uniref:VCBS repeat-containing protein n=2 Tax=Streptomonospora TaxID=104204 RepID=A0ABV9SKI6_9ACTN
MRPGTGTEPPLDGDGDGFSDLVVTGVRTSGGREPYLGVVLGAVPRPPAGPVDLNFG